MVGLAASRYALKSPAPPSRPVTGPLRAEPKPLEDHKVFLSKAKATAGPPVSFDANKFKTASKLNLVTPKFKPRSNSQADFSLDFNKKTAFKQLADSSLFTKSSDFTLRSNVQGESSLVISSPGKFHPSSSSITI